MCWELATDEALILEFERHDGFWMLSNDGVFFNSMDYLYRPVSYTPARTTVDSDGKVRLDPVSRRPWLSQLARHAGLRARQSDLSQPHERCADASSHPAREARGARRSVLPPDSARVTPDERLAQMRTRFDAIQRRCSL